MIKVKAISFNNTEMYAIKDAHKRFIKEIHDVYAYNPESRTHLCELTPSYELHYLYTYIVDTDAMTDTRRDELQERYCYENDQYIIYMHCADIRNLESKDCGEFENMDEAREYLCGNCPI